MSLPTDVITRILEYSCDSPHDVAARRHCLNRAWLEAYEAPLFWRTLRLSTHPVSETSPYYLRDVQKWHCKISAWSRAPAKLRRAVELHTHEVVLDNKMYDDVFCLGRGLAGQQFTRLKQVRLFLSLFTVRSQQSPEDDEAALRPLFDAEEVMAMRFGVIPQNAWNYSPTVKPSQFFSKFRRLRRFEVSGLSLLLGEGDHVEPQAQFFVARDGDDADRVASLTYLDREQACQLVELESVYTQSLAVPGGVPAGLFPCLKRLTVAGNPMSLPFLEVIFGGVATGCPVIEMLTLWHENTLWDDPLDADGSWAHAENYPVFAHAPRTLKALVLVLGELRLPVKEASSFVSLVKAHLPGGVQLHVTARSNTLENDGVLPESPWAPGLVPEFGVCYDDADLAQASFTGSEW